ncbi:Uncharacterised protein [uncultured archaeon]|nr:Uncharacterised protein [uncultured archaeon]
MASAITKLDLANGEVAHLGGLLSTAKNDLLLASIQEGPGELNHPEAKLHFTGGRELTEEEALRARNFFKDTVLRQEEEPRQGATLLAAVQEGPAELNRPEAKLHFSGGKELTEDEALRARFYYIETVLGQEGHNEGGEIQH